jgi:hypothetical protein
MMSARKVDFRFPQTWEFSGFSQNGEDGILDILRKHLKTTNRYFIEIGSADGIDNNSAWLTIAEKYQGMMIEGSADVVDRAKRMIGHYSLGLQIVNMFVDRSSIGQIKSLTQYSNPDVMSLDIDGMDYYIAEALMFEGFRPKIFVVEYNSVFGPNVSKTIKYEENFVYTRAHSSELYYGVSIAGWKNFFNHYGYKFVTVDKNGVNAFFVDPNFFETDFLTGIQSLHFSENQLQFLKFRGGHENQFKLIEHMDFHEIQ